MTELLEPRLSMFGEMMTVQRTPILSLNSSFGPSARRDIQATANGGTIALVGGEIRLRTSAAANGSAALYSAERGVYVSGYMGEAGIGLRIPTAPTGNQIARWGIRNATSQEGLYFGQDATGIFVARLTGGVETKYYQADWNVDKMDGEGRSGFNLDTADGHICQVDFSWYGDGQIMWGVAARTGRQQVFIPCHEEKYNGELSIKTPNLPVFAELDNGGDTSSIDVYVHGRQYSVVGDFIPPIRFTGQERGSTATSTTAKPLVSARTKAGFEDRSRLVAGFQAFAVTEDCVIEIRLNGTLTGASWMTPTNHTAAETALEVDNSATAISGGVVIYTDMIKAGNNTNAAQLNEANIALNIPEDQPVSLCVRTLSGTGTITSNLRIAEHW